MSHETIYKRIYEDKRAGGTLWQSLRCCRKRRKRYGSGRQRRGRIPNRIGIENRCPRVEARATVGHWEGDTVMGKNGKYAFVTLVERKTGFALVRKVKTRHAHGVATAIIEALQPLQHLVRTITFDNGLEFSQHERMAQGDRRQKSILLTPIRLGREAATKTTTASCGSTIPKAAVCLALPLIICTKVNLR